MRGFGGSRTPGQQGHASISRTVTEQRGLPAWRLGHAISTQALIDSKSTGQWSFRSLFSKVFKHHTSIQTKKILQKEQAAKSEIATVGLPWGSVLKSLPAAAGDPGSIPNPGGSCMPQSN